MYERNYDLINRKFKEFFLPTLLMSMSTNISMVVDSLIVSFLIGAINISAIQVVAPILTFINLLYWMVGFGGSLISSTAKSDHDEEKGNLYFTIAFISLIVLGVLFALLCYLNMDSLINLLCRSENIVPLVNDYFTAYIIGIPFIFIIMGLSYFVRVDGKPNTAFQALLIANIVNLCLDFVYISVFNLGIFGAGLATSTGFIVGTLYLMRYFFMSDRTMKFVSLAKYKISTLFKYLKDIAVLGFSSSSSQLFLTINLLVFNNIIGSLMGSSGFAAFGICRNLLFILFIFLIGTAQSMSPIVSIYYNEEDYNTVAHLMKQSFKIVLISSFVMSLIFAVYPQLAVVMYSVKEGVDVNLVLTAVRLYALSYVGNAVTFLMMFYMQSIKRKSFALLISALEGLILPIALIYPSITLFGSNAIWLSFVLAEIITIICILITTKFISKKSNGEYNGLYLLKDISLKEQFEFSLDANIDDVITFVRDLSKTFDGILDERSITLLSLAVEDMIGYIIQNNETLKSIDFIINITDENVILSIKDEGKEFNPTVIEDGDKFSNIAVLNKIADKIDYARVLGLNSTVITIGR